MLLAEQAADKGLLWNLDFWKVINLLVFVIILVYIFRNKLKIGQVFDSRAQSIRKELETAKREKQEAEQKLTEVAARLGRLDQDIAAIRTEAQQEAQRESDRIRQTAEADIEKIRQTTLREIDGAMRAARAELKAFVSDQSVQMAETIIKREMRPEDERRLLAEYLEGLREVKG
jgi:F0F1-type ATP synthase membrane subunit b/b'